ncbi:MAG: OmpA family protein [Caulobacterales bacterium]|jgi:outer membrane protein OmpA-like peptidoglycan-associated protein|nr:OmpA family protein [Caulobacterales bacterium]
MRLKSFFIAATAAAVLSGCAATQAADEARAPFDPAACYERNFSVYFEGDTTELTPLAREVIDLQAEAIAGCRINSVRIIGLTDADGSHESNRQVSVRRAEVLEDYLAQRSGWPRSRTELLAAGESGAVTQDGLNVPMRNRARIIVNAVAP